MQTPYNIALFERFKDSLCFCVERSKFSLYLKSTPSPQSLDEVMQLGYIYAENTDTPEVVRVSNAWAVFGFGNLLYAFTMMELNQRGIRVCCDSDLNVSEEASVLWERINDNPTYHAKGLPPEAIREEYLEDITEYGDHIYKKLGLDWDNNWQSAQEVAKWYQDESKLHALPFKNKSYTTTPDEGYLHACQNHDMNRNPSLASSLCNQGSDYFIKELDYGNGNCCELYDIKDDNYSKLEAFLGRNLDVAFDDKLNSATEAVESQQEVNAEPTNTYRPQMTLKP